MKRKPEKGQENILRHQEISPGEDMENVRPTLVPPDDSEGANLVEKRESLVPEKPLREEEEKDRR
jgi:hypothetical protein